jgi:hypothetical protein
MLRLSRSSSICVQAKLKIAQNHSKGVQLDTERLYNDGGYLPPPQFAPAKIAAIPGALAACFGMRQSPNACN